MLKRFIIAIFTCWCAFHAADGMAQGATGGPVRPPQEDPVTTCDEECKLKEKRAALAAQLQSIEDQLKVYSGGTVELLVGGGPSIGRDDYVDFQVKNNEVLLIRNDSRLRASAIAGLNFRIRDLCSTSVAIKPLRETADCAGHVPTGIFASFQFTQNTANTLDGFMFGATWRIQDHLHFFAGVSLQKGKELSRGFVQKAEEVFKRKFDDVRDFDGVSLKNPATGQLYFPESPIVDSFNTGFHLGFVMPVRFRSFLSVFD